MIRSLAPLPEDLEKSGIGEDARGRTLPEALEGRYRGDNTGGCGPPSPPIPTEGTSVSTKEDDRGRKRTTSEDLEAEASKQEKKSPTEGPASGGAFSAQRPQGDLPSNES